MWVWCEVASAALQNRMEEAWGGGDSPTRRLILVATNDYDEHNRVAGTGETTALITRSYWTDDDGEEYHDEDDQWEDGPIVSGLVIGEALVPNPHGVAEEIGIFREIIAYAGRLMLRSRFGNMRGVNVDDNTVAVDPQPPLEYRITFSDTSTSTNPWWSRDQEVTG